MIFFIYKFSFLLSCYQHMLTIHQPCCRWCSEILTLFCPLLIFFKINFFENSSWNTIRVSNSLDPGRARHFVGPDLGLNCLQRLSVDDTIGG